MSSVNSIMPSHAVSQFDERKWVIQIRKTLDEDLGEDTEIPVSIFSVPKTLMLIDPDSYMPQQVAIGPYHYWRQEMYEMERYKLAAAKRMQKHLEDLKFHDVVQQLIRYEQRIRAYYHKYLTCSGETIGWMMSVDACFLLEFLQLYALKEGKLLSRISSRMSHLLDIAGRKSAHNAIMRDLIMLENQIPLFVLRKMLEFQYSSLEMADNMLYSMLMGFSKVLYPFKTMEELPKVAVMERPHLLDLLYHLVVPDFFVRRPSEIMESGEANEGKQGANNNLRGTGHVKQFLNEVWKILSKLKFIKKILFSRVLQFVTKLPWTIISNLPGIKILKAPIESFFVSGEKAKDDRADEDSSNQDKPPLVEEIAIPSVTQLSKACINFVPTNGGMKTIKFDAKKRTFYLPSISLDANTEVTLKNIVAYEACNASGPVIFTRYTEFMNGIIDTEEDARLLREKGIILNRLKSDEEVANLWNGMNRCVRLTKAPFLDKVIEDVNKYYNGRWSVKVKNFMKAYVFGSWQVLTLLACISLLLLMTLQAFCSVFTCKRILGLKNEE